MTNSNNNIRSVSDYNLGGLNAIWLLNIDSFGGCKFKDDDLPHRCLVESIIASEPFVELEAINESNFTETYSEGIYKQKLSTFIYPLQGETLSKIMELSAKKYFIVFQSKHNRCFGFGNEEGASITFSQQTGRANDIQGYNLSIEKESTTPVFEIVDINKFITRYKYIPCFDDGVFCQLTNGVKNGLQIAPFALKTSLSGKAMDVNGSLSARSGLPQAVMLLEGFRNPDNKFQVEGTYSEHTTHLNNCSIVRYNHLCQPESGASIKLSESKIELKDNVYLYEVKVTSSHPWQLIADKKDIAKSSIQQGEAGETFVRFYKGTQYGLAKYTFRTANSKALLSVYNYPLSETISLSNTYIAFKKTTDKEEKTVQITSSTPWKLDTKLTDTIVCTPSYGKAGTTDVTITKETTLQNINLTFSAKRGITCTLHVIASDKEIPNWVLGMHITSLPQFIFVWDDNGYWINDREYEWIYKNI